MDEDISVRVQRLRRLRGSGFRVQGSRFWFWFWFKVLVPSRDWMPALSSLLSTMIGIKNQNQNQNPEP
jgi:hypothetical protein